MNRSRALRWVGLACLLAGGAVLAFAGDAGTTWGTTLGIAGVALLAWSWARRG